jgi:hypothetical protein
MEDAAGADTIRLQAAPGAISELGIVFAGFLGVGVEQVFAGLADRSLQRHADRDPTIVVRIAIRHGCDRIGDQLIIRCQLGVGFSPAGILRHAGRRFAVGLDQ